MLEDRLKQDVLSELEAFDGRLLLHAEDEDGLVNPVWELVESAADVKTVREMFDQAADQTTASGGPTLRYHRLPITAEKSPDFSDMRDLVEIVAQLDVESSAIIVNCQLGRGRSTRAQIIITLVQRWLRSAGTGLHTGDGSTRSNRPSYT